MITLKQLISLLFISSTFIYLPVSLAEQQADKHSDSSEHGDESGEHNEDADGHDDDNGQNIISLTEQQISLAGIKVKTLQLQELKTFIEAPAEVTFNRYKTVSITPRISAQLIKRHVVLGQLVGKGQAIATLSSVQMAEAQADVLVSSQEWLRVKKLGKKIVSQRRYIEAQINWELAKAKAKTYGMSNKQIDKLIKSTDFSRANGRFELLALIDGIILEEDYIVGQQIEPGQQLNLITDESTLWVMANVTPRVANQIKVGNNASVQWNEQNFPAQVSQIYHSLDEVTRTFQIRLSVENSQDILHSGLFVNSQIEVTSNTTLKKVVMVAESALTRSSDGDWQVFVQQDKEGEFQAVEIDVVKVVAGQAVIEGVAAGQTIVIEGAFFVQSELAKSGFQAHNH